MAELSGLPAMDIDPVGFGARQSLLMSQAQQAQQTLQSNDLDLQQKTALAPIELKDAKTKSRLADISAANETMAQVARDTAAADPADAPDVWDRGMKAAVDSGVQAASQYIGHYRPDLAERVGDVYGGGKTGASASAAPVPDQQAMLRAVDAMPPAQMTQALGNLNRAISSFNNVKDQASWDAELSQLKEGGIDPSQFLPSLDWNPMNYAMAARTIKSLVPYRDAMASRAALLASKAPVAAAAPLGTSTYIGVDPQTQKPIYHNSVTGEDTVGKTPIAPKPTAAVSTFQFKLKAAQGAGMSDGEALAFANGTKSLPPERLQAIALTEANKELGDATLAGAVISNPDAWVRDKARQNYQLLTASAVQTGGAGGAGGGGANKPAPAALPQRAVDAVKQAGGRPVRFNNGLSYKWDAKAGRAVQVK